ncbi:phosphoribosylformylglycinamidine synthase subunit PurS [Salisediminibacterium selenitireducens]|uniref:Phosphoribosylformylglycinamidine synthase subunit PurS n=1 Tax=Bacillus selenitireducens (strain ATCC 700615 / DSM 15326 / MLS10) TaxID=439292 RepID=D6XYR9_BACIE|nr:phosphoribosylformylglycinamidine synthase subunit PurS [Salisediminibacterium selenitireducens]ADH98227.1 phosphoribosylformylglycinamidine synthase, purS [[Bacillus] selenitireducens MLS10]
MNANVTVYVSLKEGVLDPQGSAVEKSLHQLGYESVADVRVGKTMTLTMSGDSKEAIAKQVEAMCDQLLANPVIEDFTYEIEEVLSV